MEELYVLKKLDDTASGIGSVKAEMVRAREKASRAESDGEGDKAAEIYKEIDNLKNKLIEHVSALKLYLMELENDMIARYSGKVIEALERFNIKYPDYSKFGETIDNLLKSVKERSNIDAGAAGRLMNTVKMGYFPTDLDNVRHIKRAIEFPDKQVNVADPCVGCALAVYELVKGENADTYGIELDEARAEQARKLLTRTGKGSFFGSRISNEVFHLLFLNPPYMTVCSPDGFNVRSEKRFLVESLRLLMIDGILVYIVPYYRLTADICRVLADNFRDIRIYRFTDREFSRFKQVAVFGVKKKRENNPGEANQLNKNALSPETIPFITSIETVLYSLPSVTKKVELFKGAVFDVAELAEQLKVSNSHDILFKKSELDSVEKRPLLPFTVGQIGLIGGSGLLNGLIECDTPHVLKGRIVKEVRENVKEAESGSGRKGKTCEVTETVVNRMEFNILSVNGIKKLA